jgi:GNAT superfamily N-acetyltransferase
VFIGFVQGFECGSRKYIPLNGYICHKDGDMSGKDAKNYNSGIEYGIENHLHADEFIAVLKESTLAERRPIDNREKMEAMCRNANLVVTARHNGRLIGVARCITDFVYCTYLSDLAVSQDFQRSGIGRELIRRVKEAVPETLLLLLAAPKAMDYYPAIGMTRHEGAFILREVSEIKGGG